MDWGGQRVQTSLGYALFPTLTIFRLEGAPCRADFRFSANQTQARLSFLDSRESDQQNLPGLRALMRAICLSAHSEHSS